MYKNNLKQLRKDKGVTQAQIAEAIGVSTATIGNYEQGTRKPRNNEIWQKLSDYFHVPVDDLMDKPVDNLIDKKEIDTENNIKRKSISPSAKRNVTLQFRTDIPIIYDGVNITSLVFSKYDDVAPITREQQYTYAEYSSRSGHFLYARKNLLNILDEIKHKTTSEISNDLDILIKRIKNNVVYWYKKCWNNIDDLFPEATNIETIYDLLNKCLCVDMIGEQEFSLIPIKDDFDWLREKLR